MCNDPSISIGLSCSLYPVRAFTACSMSRLFVRINVINAISGVRVGEGNNKLDLTTYLCTPYGVRYSVEFGNVMGRTPVHTGHGRE